MGLYDWTLGAPKAAAYKELQEEVEKDVAELTGVTTMSQGLGHPPSMVGIAGNMGNVMTVGGGAGYNTYAGGGGGGAGGGGFLPAKSFTNIQVTEVENGYIVNINGATYICEDAEQVSARILASMVIKKMEK